MSHAYLVTQRQFAAGAASEPKLGTVRAPEAANGIRDTATVDLSNWHSLHYWARWLGVSEQQLIRATRAAGTHVAAIEAHLAERRARRRRRLAAEA